MKGTLLSSEIAEPYAQALMSVAQENNLGESFAQEISSLLELLKNSPELQGFLRNPTIKPEAKKAVIQQILGNAPAYLGNFLNLLVDKRRIFFIEEIGEQYLALWRQMNNTVLAEVTSAAELSEIQRQAVIDKVKGISGAQAVKLQTVIDPNLIGGVVIRIGSQVYDASLSSQLRRIGLSLLN
jgi:F-type H+-transporting ATPase subunit delta